MEDNEYYKIYIEINTDGRTEPVWAMKEGDYYEIWNVPFFAYGLACYDIIATKQVGIQLFFDKKIKNSGHSTYRVFLQENGDFEFYWDILDRLKCTYERATKSLYAIDVPPDADIHEVYRILEMGEQRGAWEFEEGFCGHPEITN